MSWTFARSSGSHGRTVMTSGHPVQVYHLESLPTQSRSYFGEGFTGIWAKVGPEILIVVDVREGILPGFPIIAHTPVPVPPLVVI